MARQTIISDDTRIEHEDRVEGLPRVELGPSQWTYKTIADIEMGLRALPRNGAIRGNLRAALDTVFHAIGNDAIGDLVQDNDISGILRVINDIDGSLPIKEISESNKQKLEEAMKVAEGTVDKAKVDQLVAEYEAHLEKVGDSAQAAKDLLAQYKNSGQIDQVKRLIDQLQDQQKTIAEDLKKLKVEAKVADRVAEEVAPELARAVGKAEAAGLDINLVKKALEEPIVEAYAAATVLKVDGEALVAAQAIDKKFAQITLSHDPAVAKEQRILIEELKTTGKDLGDEVLFEKAVNEITTNFYNKLVPSNKGEGEQAPGAPLVNAQILEDGTLQEKLRKTISEVARDSLVLQKLSTDEVLTTFKNEGFDLSNASDELKKLTIGMQNLAKENPVAATSYIERETYKGLVEGLVIDNGMDGQKAAQLAQTITEIYSPATNPMVRSGITNDQAMAAAFAYNESEGVKHGPEHLNNLTEGALTVRFNQLRSFAGLGVVRDVEKLKNDVASLKDSRVLNKYAPGLAGTLRELDPRLAGLLDKIGKSQLLVKMGRVGTMFQAVEGSVVGRAMLSMATGDFTTAASSFALGLLGKTSLKAGLEAVGTKLAGTALGKLAAGIAANAAPVIGQIASALMIASTAKDILSIPLNKFGEFLDKLGINIGSSISNGLKKAGIEGLPNTILTGIGTIGSMIGLLTAFLGSLVAIPLAPILIVVFVGMIGLQAYQGGPISNFVPSRDAIGGGGGSENSSTEGQVIYYKDVIPEGCPSGWPLPPGSAVMSQGSYTNDSHHGSDSDSVDLATGVENVPVSATHNGTVYCLHSDNVGYGNYIELEGKCPIPQPDGSTKEVVFRTRYAHMNQLNECSKAGEPPIVVPKGANLGLSGNVGNSTGPHVHYQIVGGVLGNIVQYLPLTQDQKNRVGGGIGRYGCVGVGACGVSL